MKNALLSVLIVLPMIIVGCNEDSPVTTLPEQPASTAVLSGDSEDSVDFSEIENRWIRHEALEDFLAFAEKYRLRKHFGDRIIDAVIERASRYDESLIPQEIYSWSVEEIDEKRETLQKLLAGTDELNDMEKAECMEAFEGVAAKCVMYGGKRKSKAASMLASGPMPSVGNDVISSTVWWDLWSGDYHYDDASFTASYRLPADYPDRQVRDITGTFDCNSDPTYKSSRILAAMQARGCKVGSWYFTPDIYTYTSSWTASCSYSHNFGSSHASQIDYASSELEIDYSLEYKFQPDGWPEQENYYDLTFLPKYEFGGRGDVAFNVQYTTADYVRIEEIVVYNDDMDEYESDIAADANGDGTPALISDLYKVLLILNYPDTHCP